VTSPVELWGHVAPHFRTLHLQNSSSASGVGGGSADPLKDSIPTINTVFKTSYTENEQFEHLNKAEIQAEPVAKFIDPE
jgi:hypothetical protein